MLQVGRLDLREKVVRELLLQRREVALVPGAQVANLLRQPILPLGLPRLRRGLVPPHQLLLLPLHPGNLIGMPSSQFPFLPLSLRLGVLERGLQLCLAPPLQQLHCGGVLGLQVPPVLLGGLLQLPELPLPLGLVLSCAFLAAGPLVQQLVLEPRHLRGVVRPHCLDSLLALRPQILQSSGLLRRQLLSDPAHLRGVLLHRLRHGLLAPRLRLLAPLPVQVVQLTREPLLGAL
mmetsp:Transcript_3171/g.11500  ORF Transcript_3171/g.11500 Transcript_3171/m.11500 type:complete len:233 (-) Transcript_3171:316-1014(-)